MMLNEKKQTVLGFQPLKKKPLNVSATSDVTSASASSTSQSSVSAVATIGLNPTNDLQQPSTIPLSDVPSNSSTIPPHPVNLITPSLTSTPVRGKPLKSSTDCNPNDIGIVLERLDKLSDIEKINFIDKVWKPPPEFAFPQHEECGRRCSDSPKFCKWLVYSAYYDGVFCLPCVLFGKSLGQTKLQKLFTEPLTRWNGMSSKFNNHQTKCPLHKRSMDVMHALIDEQSGEKHPIDRIIDSQRTVRINANRKKLIPIIKTVILCARQNISLRGHRDDSTHLQNKANNPGNFQSLLEFRIDSGDKVLENHFKDCPKNASYRSKTIQNEIIAVIGKCIRQVISDEIKKARFFSIIADEATDASLTEQMALVIRFIDDSSQIREEFVEFIECESTSAEHLVEKLKKGMESLSLDINDLRGQGYDGAGNMAGAKSGVSARILQICPKAHYFHCASHRLNLAVATSTSIRGVKNMMDTIRKCSEIFHFSTKKNHLLQEQIKELMPSEMRSTLLDVCKTRWLQRIDGLERVQELMVPILATLDLVSSNHDGSYAREARSDAQGVTGPLSLSSS